MGTFSHFVAWHVGCLPFERQQQSVVTDWETLVPRPSDRSSCLWSWMAGSADLFAARWDGGLPGCLACGRRPAFGFNCPAPLVGSLKSALRDKAYARTGPGKQKHPNRAGQLS